MIPSLCFPTCSLFPPIPRIMLCPTFPDPSLASTSHTGHNADQAVSGHTFRSHKQAGELSPQHLDQAEMEVMKTNKLTDVGTRVTCSRPSRRRELYSLPWDRRRHSDHRRRVQSAGPRIDNTPPVSSVYTHVRSGSMNFETSLSPKSKLSFESLIPLEVYTG